MSSSNDSLAMQRITKLVDENSFMEIGSLVTARNTDFNLADTDTPSDGVITGYGRGCCCRNSGTCGASAHAMPERQGGYAASSWTFCA